jgi:hypothetical protein
MGFLIYREIIPKRKTRVSGALAVVEPENIIRIGS